MSDIRIGTALAVITALVVGASVHAAELETVVVTGSRGLTQKEVTRTTNVLPIQEISLSYTVKIADLDSKTAAGRAEIERRVKAAATAACEEIDRLALGDPTSPSTAVCVKKAVDDAMAKIK